MMNRWEKQLESKRGLCPACGKVHYMNKLGSPGRGNSLRLTAKGWWATDPARRQAR